MMKILPTAAVVLALGAFTAVAQTATTTTQSTTTITTEDVGKVRTYVMKEKKPSVKVTEQVSVDAALPQTVTIYEIPASVDVRGSYAVVNDKTYLVGPDRKVIRVIE